jgi:hypothetical protein
MRILVFGVLLVALAPLSSATAGGSADEIRKTISGRTCSTPGVSYHFARDGKFRRQESATRSSMRTSWQGTYSVSEGAILLNIASGGYVKGVQSVVSFVTGNKLYIAPYREPSGFNLGAVVFECR